jgi:hypothetical protein
MTLQEIRKREFLKEKSRLVNKKQGQNQKRASYKEKSLPASKTQLEIKKRMLDTEREMLQRSKRDIGFASGSLRATKVALYEAGLDSYKKKLKQYNQDVKKYAARLDRENQATKAIQKPKPLWPIETLKELNYKNLTQWSALPSCFKGSERIGILLIPIAREQYKIYLASLDQNDVILPKKDGSLGKLLIAEHIDSVLKKIALQHQLLLIFDVEEEELCLREKVEPFLFPSPSRNEGQQVIKKNYNLAEGLMSVVQLSTLLSGIFVYGLNMLNVIFNKSLSNWWIIGYGIILPLLGALIGNISYNRSSKLSANFKLAGNILLVFSAIIVGLSFFQEINPFPQVVTIFLGALWLTIAGFMIIGISEPLPLKDNILIDAQFCDCCIGRGIVEKGSSAVRCAMCLGTGMLGEHIDQEIEIRTILKKRRPVIVFVLLQPIISSIAYITRDIWIEKWMDIIQLAHW